MLNTGLLAGLPSIRAGVEAGTTYHMRKALGLPLLPARPISKDGYPRVARLLYGRADLAIGYRFALHA